MGELLALAEPKERRRFADFANEPAVLDGQKGTLDSILGKEIQILAFRTDKSKFEDSKTGMYTRIQFQKGGEKYILFTGSSILARQCEQYEDQMPFFTTIQKISRYYTMT